MSAQSTSYRFKPRFVSVAFLSLSLGVLLITAGATLTPDIKSSVFAFAVGALGVFLSFSYLRSPVWKLAVDIQDNDLVVWNGTEERLRLSWSAVLRVVVDEQHQHCYVDGGTPEQSLLVPGPGAAASYAINKRHKLIKEILAKVPSAKVCTASEVAANEESASEESASEESASQESASEESA